MSRPHWRLSRRRNQSLAPDEERDLSLSVMFLVRSMMPWIASAIQLPALLWAAVGGCVALWYLTLTESGGGRRLRA